MTIEEQIKEWQSQKNVNFPSGTFYIGYFYGGLSFKGSLEWLEKAIRNGEIDELRQFLPCYEAEFKRYKAAIELYKKWKGEKKIETFSDSEIAVIKQGVLVVQPLNALYVSRLLRDAEKRCLKHPRFQKI